MPPAIPYTSVIFLGFRRKKLKCLSFQAYS